MTMRRRPGRPALVEGEESVPQTVRLPASDYDRVDEIARRDRCSVPTVIRRAVSRLLDEADDDE